ncbi:glycosyl hydrolase [Streptomyces sp. NPDC090053]|uniref:glycoside hydrolase family 26 protein n=1 Tax=Streptomyces sp. NPDC090053 TaxID=3365932 RepID=UPI003815FBF5
MPHHHRRLTGACIGAVAAGLLMTGAGLAQGAPLPLPPGPAPAGSAPPGPAPAASPAPEPAVGAYLDYGAAGVRRMADLSRWLGGADLRVGHTYLPGDDWSNIEGRPAFLGTWAAWRRAEADRMFVLNVPMQEHNEDRVSDYEVRDLIQQGARGDFDEHYRKLARRLVSLGVPDTVVVLGWEMNGTTFTSRCGPDPEGWKTYWNRIVAAMRSVPGQKFTFDFAPNRGPDDVPWTACYPGDDSVDVIGMDSYDQPPGNSFDDQVKGPYGLQAQVDFAAAHRKQISYPEWGLFKNGDNTDYMRRMLDWFDVHRPLYQTITDYCPHGVWQCGQNPRAAEIFRTKVSEEAKPEETGSEETGSAETGPQPSTQPGTPPSTRPSTQPSTQPTPGTGTPPVAPEAPPQTNTREWCLPAGLGEWLGRWVDPRQICVGLPGR